MLSTAPGQWGLRVAADRANREHHFRGRVYTYEELVRLRSHERLREQVDPARWQERHAACQRALDRLSEEFVRAAPDAAVIVGNDQRELFDEDILPALSVYWGEMIENIPLSAEQLAQLPPGLAVAEEGHCPPDGATYPGLPELGRHLIASLIAEDFDVAQSRRLPAGAGRRRGIPHAFGFVYRRIMADQVIPNVPVILNTFYPPNQPSLRRCYSLGQAIRRAVASWDADRKVALIASGGLSHFVIDEKLDGRVITAMMKNDESALGGLPPDHFQSGTSEIKNWVPVAAAAADAGLKMELADYVPCYRSEAGTGNAMGFAYWRS